MKLWVDPPEGWKFGFPKVYDDARDGDIYDWIAAQGYPQELIDSCGTYFHIRYWPTDNCKKD